MIQALDALVYPIFLTQFFTGYCPIYCKSPQLLTIENGQVIGLFGWIFRPSITIARFITRQATQPNHILRGRWRNGVEGRRKTRRRAGSLQSPPANRLG